jgi:hypothetical protein
MTLHAAICAEESKQRVEIGFWRIPKLRNVEAITLARKAARSNFTPTELTEIAQRLRGEKEINTSVADPSQSDETKDTKMMLSSKTTNEIVEEQVPGQDTKADGKTDNPKAAGTGPVSLASLGQGFHC